MKVHVQITNGGQPGYEVESPEFAPVSLFKELYALGERIFVDMTCAATFRESDAAVGQRAVSGAAPVAEGEPERAASEFDAPVLLPVGEHECVTCTRCALTFAAVHPACPRCAEQWRSAECEESNQDSEADE